MTKKLFARQTDLDNVTVDGNSVYLFSGDSRPFADWVEIVVKEPTPAFADLSVAQLSEYIKARNDERRILLDLVDQALTELQSRT